VFQPLSSFLFPDIAAGSHLCAMRDTLITAAPNSLLLAVSYANSMTGLALVASGFPPPLLFVSVVSMP